MNVSDPGLPTRPTVALKPRWIVGLLLLLVVYLLLRPWLVERFGWDLPGLTDVNSQVGSDEDSSTAQRPGERQKANRPIDVPLIPDQGESDLAGDSQIASADDADQVDSPANEPASTKASTTTGRSSQEKSSPLPPMAEPSRSASTSQSRPPVAPSSKATSPVPGAQPVSRGPPAPSTAQKPSGTKKTQAPSKKASPTPDDKDQGSERGVLTQIGRDRFESTEGLVYNQYRIDHVMEHARDNADKPAHGVFEVTTQDEILALIDEAYSIARKRGPPQVVIEDQGDRTTYTVNMNRKIGRAGGQSGARNRNRPLNKLKLVLEDNEVITAYPTN